MRPCCRRRTSPGGWRSSRFAARRAAIRIFHYSERTASTISPWSATSNSGKTNLMITALRQLIESFAPSNGITVRFANAAEEIDFQRKIQDLDAGQVMGATVRVETPTAFNLVLEPKQGPSSTLYMYDAAGEDFQIGDRMLTGQRFHRYTDAILLVVDPSAEEDLQRQYPDVDWKSMNPARENISVIEGRMIPFWERALSVGSDRRFSVPLAVIVTKMDGLKAYFTRNSDELNGTYADMEKVAEAACRDSARVSPVPDRRGPG